MSELEEGMGVGEFARLSRLSPKALRLYERKGDVVSAGRLRALLS